jgi:hypothetical protein
MLERRIVQDVIFEKKASDIYTKSRISDESGAIHVKEQALSSSVSWRSSLVHVGNSGALMF